MREKMVKLAKQAGKLLAIELFVPGGTLVVLTILLARGRGKSMTDTVMIVGLISALVLKLGGAALSVAPTWAEVKASESEVLALKQEAATSRAQLQKLSAGTGAETKRIDLPVTPNCASRPEALAERLRGGVRDLTTGWTAFFHTVAAETVEHGPANGVFVGSLEGTNQALQQTLRGAYETTTFFLPVPRPQPSASEPGTLLEVRF